MSEVNETISFSYNWNGKLNNKAFTTLRIHNPRKYIVGKTYCIELSRKQKGKAVLNAKRVLKISQLNEFICFLDTGYSREETLKIIKRMYKNINLNTALFDFCLLVYTQKTDQVNTERQTTLNL
jgi:hypothetical protein